MAPIPAPELAELRSWVGAGPTSADLEARYGSLGTWQAVALQVTREAYHTMLSAGPAAWEQNGDTREDWTANLQAMARKVATLEGLASGTVSPTGLPVLTVGQLVNARWRR